jgi:HIP---CoA ligase
VLVPVNTRFKAAEAGDIIRRSQAKLLLVRKNFLGLDFDFSDGKADIPVIDLKSDFLASGTPTERKVSENDAADIIYTSGTTGRPKGVMNLIASPFFHIFGYKAGCIASMIRGVTILPVPVFDIDNVLDLVERERVTVLPGPPTVYHELLKAHRQGGRDLSTLRVAVTGAADIPVELIRQIRQELPFRSIMTGYGLTEAGTITASRQTDSLEDIATTVGTPTDGFEMRIAADGELLARGYGVMKGYLDDPEATAQAVDSGGWLHTGDLGTIDKTAVSRSSAGRRTCSSSAASTPTRPRSRAS